ncbi:MAG: hypothetical protein OXN83_03500 [Oligoflexia bacterium]|nr:hypothetical protein [Oligoflexia bacterium]
MEIGKYSSPLHHRVFFVVMVSLLVFFFLTLDQGAFAGTTGSEFKQLSDTIDGWIGGYLGKVIAVAGGVTVLFLSRFTAAGWIAAGGVALAISEGPNILESMVSALI